ncbi:MAG TPA: TPM domain-containing protein, partial [Thermoanaerobaculia bacterium]|nr:TPM domain-containing protein [Thermoanaerobaculia bacterium]
RVEKAIEAAESITSGEVRVAVSPLFWGDVRKVADRAFDRLGMRATAERNGVLLFVVPSRRRFVVLGDTGIHEKVHPGFWDEVAAEISRHFRSGDFTGGIVAALERLSNELATHFPRRSDDVDELPNAVEFLD